MWALAGHALRPSADRASRMPLRRAASRPASFHVNGAPPVPPTSPCCSLPRNSSSASRMAASSSGVGLPHTPETSNPRESSASLTAPPSFPRLQRDVAVLARRQGLPLRQQHLQGGDEPRAGLLRLDDVVHVAPLRCD